MRDLVLVNQIIQEIENHVKATHRNYGKLLQWRENYIYHFGIGLSDDFIFDTGQNWAVFTTKCLSDKGINIEEVQNINAFPADEVIARLKHALICFREWEYSFFSWNCEHLARLATTNDPICYQVKETRIPLVSWWYTQGKNENAQTCFNNYLQRVQANLAHNAQISPANNS